MIREYKESDRLLLCEFFAALILRHKDYISHGELQMGVATDEHTLSGDYKQVWLRYLDRQVENENITILVYDLDEKIEGFIIFGIDDDGADPYGVIFDMGVNEQLRGRSIGSLLIEQALSAFKVQGISSIYLESGLNNHSAHSFFEKFGFKHISNIFRMKLE